MGKLLLLSSIDDGILPAGMYRNEREAMEEGYMTIKDVSLALVIESDYF